MKNLLLVIALLPCIMYSQGFTSKLKKNSEEVFIYKLTAAVAENYLQWDSIPVDNYANREPDYRHYRGHSLLTDLPAGFYLYISIDSNEVVAYIETVSNLLVYPVNNQFNTQFEVRNKQGEYISNASLWLGKQEAKYHASSQNYWLKKRNPAPGLIKVYAPGDTLFLQADPDEKEDPVIVQRWKNFKYSKAGNILLWLPRKIGSIGSSYNSHRRSKYAYAGTGYVLLDQPKYKINDSVKTKAFLFNSKKRLIQSAADLYLEYYYQSKSHSQFLANINPVSPGSFLYNFRLNDSLPSDIKYDLVYKNKKGKILIRKNFSTEDYLLDEIAQYKIRSEKETYFPQDSLRFFASAKDANGLPVLDGNATLTVTTSQINSFYKDSLYVPDTLFTGQKPLAPEGETSFAFAATKLPNASLELQASVTFKNSNNEMQTEIINVQYEPLSKKLVIHTEADSIYADYLVNGKSTAAIGDVDFSGDFLDDTRKLTYPAAIRIEPLSDDYFFTVTDGKDTITELFDFDDKYNLELRRISSGDTTGFILENPRKIPVNFLVTDGDKLVAAAKSDAQNIEWKSNSLSRHKIYQVRWSYYWNGEKRGGQDRLAVLYKLLDVKLDHENTVFPGQKDSVTITVKDYKNRPAAGVNLAAVAYNSQFKKDIKVNDPPYLASYRSRRQITRNAYEADDPFTVKKYHVGEHKAWIKKMGVDSLPFFKMIFPATAPYDVATAISDFPPQLSVHIVKKGAPQEIYLLYINRKLVYYNGVTDKVNDAYPAYGYTQIAIRFRDKYLEIDSLYMQPFYKHDLFIDLDHLPLHATVSDVADYWSMAEKNLIELNTWQLKSNVSEAYVWQYDHVVKLSDKTYHLTGPFVKPDTMHYFSPDRFDIHFPFEPGYEYSLSPNILRLEKKALFPNDTAKYYLPKVESPVLIIGDTIQEPPVISYVKGKQATGSPIAEHPFKLSSSWEYSMYKKENNSGRLKLSFLKIDKLKYIAFIKNDSSDTRLIFDANNNNINNIIPGRYHLILVNANWNVAVFDINIFPDQTLCLNTSSAVYSPNDSIIHLLEKKEIPKVIPPTETKTFEIQINNAKNLPNYLAGNALIVGKVTDSKGMLPVMGASVRLKGINFGTSTDNNGIFSINKIQEGRYTIIVSSVGYNSREVNISTSTDTILIQLKPSENHLDEVVVIGYGTVSKRALTGSVISVKAVDITSTINGRAAGVSVTTEGQPGGAPLFFIRGISSIQANHPLYVIDGLLYDELPSNVKTEMVLSTEILTDASATAIYGARAANGVVVITTGSKTSRKNFKDNAIWQPELFTDKNGKASFETTYPDNITGWHLYVMAMDKKKRMGKGQSFVKSFKPLLAQLSSPLFFVENDTSELIGKASNYTNDTYNITTTLKIEKQTIFTASDTIAGSKSLPSSIKMAALQKDTLHVSYQLQTSTGFMDGEERNIPVFAAGMQETKGAFYILPNDTTLHYTSESTGGPVEIYVQNNTLDLLLQELKWLKAYPYYCMEQTASKIKGLYAEKQVLEKMQKPFTEEKQLAYLQKKLAENQLYEGGWSWWQKGKANFQITCYILNTLSEMKRDAVMQSAFRNGLLYLQNKLPGLLKEDQIEALFVMAKAHHAIDFTPYINKIPFDSLSIYQQWQWISVCKEQKLDYSNQLEQVINKRTTILPSGCYWGGENYSWHSNAAATTLLAFNLLRSETKYEYLLPSIVQYFLQLRKNGHWQNTVESASITAALMPYLLEQNKNFNNKATITISGDTSCTISQFPQKIMIGGGKSGHITISKQGGGITFLTLYQQHFDKHPQELSTHFIMQSWFESKGKKLTVIPAGEKIKMVVELNALADADYVMVQIPIPAGCNYASKPQDYQMHYEYFKNKTEIFAEHITKGKHRFEIELESRYKGSYTLNPAQALLMYFPTFSGNNALTKVAIK